MKDRDLIWFMVLPLGVLLSLFAHNRFLGAMQFGMCLGLLILKWATRKKLR